MHPLPRLKPDPLPQILTVAENMATGDLARAYAETKAAFGVPWMGVVAMAFAHYPRFYHTLWAGLGPVAASAEFNTACADLRHFTETVAADLGVGRVRGDLVAEGYTPADLAGIDQVIEVFSGGNMPYLLMATIARLALEGQALADPAGTRLTRVPPRAPVWPAGQPLVLIEAHHQNAEGAALYSDIRATLGLPFVNTDYRALARWPGYFANAWADLKPRVLSPAYAPITQAIHDRAVQLALDLPNPQGLVPAALQAAAAADASPGAVLATVRLFQWLLPGLVANIAVLRAQMG